MFFGLEIGTESEKEGRNKQREEIESVDVRNEELDERRLDDVWQEGIGFDGGVNHPL